MLQIKNLHANYEGESILQGVDLSVGKGEIHVVLGPNGSGKSTLGRVILGDSKYEVTKGEITLSDDDLLALDPAQRAQKGFFLSFQAPPAIDGVRSRDLLFAAKKSLDPSFSSSFKFKKSLETSLEGLRLDKSFSDREMNKGFSGGERKKMEMASLVALEPKVAFLDEIDSGVDVDALNAIASGFDDWFSSDKAAIIVSHSEKLLEKIEPTHVHILCHGKIIRSGGVEMIEKVHRDGFDEFLPKPDLGGLKVVS